MLFPFADALPYKIEDVFRPLKAQPKPLAPKKVSNKKTKRSAK